MSRQRDKQVKIYLSENEKEKLEKLVTKSKLNQSEYIRKSILDKNIIVIEGIQELTLELKRIGNNLNQLTKLANTDRELYDLTTIKKGLNNAWEDISKTLERVNK